MNAKRPLMLIGTVILGLSLVFIWLWLLTGPALQTHAASYTVCEAGSPTCDYDSIQSALDAASDWDEIKVAAGSYSGVNNQGGKPQVVYVNKSVTIRGGYTTTNWTTPDPVANLTILDAEGQGRVLYITGNITPTIEGLYITGGNATGLEGYNTYDAGGGMFIDTANAIVSHCIITDNHAGPATYVGNGIGGGIALLFSDAQLEYNHIISNTARWGGGARVIGGTPGIHQNQFLSNSSLYGGGMYLMWSDAMVDGNSVQDNESDYGGGMYLSGSDATIEGNVIRDNQGRFGGGIGINGGTPVLISGNLILNNVVDDYGGAISITYNDTILENNIIASNEAPTSAGVYIKQASPIFKHSTIARNTEGDGVGISIGQDSSVVMINTIIVSHTLGITVTAGSTATLDATLWGSGPWSNGIDWDGDGTIGTSVDLWGDPDFVDPDGDDYHIGSNSDAINVGIDAGLTKDIDNQPRPYQAPDIGADEYWPPSVFKYIYLPLLMK